jgi:hypothetical protein
MEAVWRKSPRRSVTGVAHVSGPLEGAASGVFDPKDQAPGFCAHTLHQPAAGTLWPAKILQPAVASPAFP